MNTLQIIGEMTVTIQQQADRIAELEKKVNRWQEQAGIYKQNLLAAQKLFANMHSNATEAWESLDLSNQSDLENARAWFFEGFAHGHTSKTKPLSDEEIISLWETIEYKKATRDERHDTIQFARAIEERILGK